VEVKLHAFVISVPDRDEWSASRFGCYILGREPVALTVKEAGRVPEPFWTQ